LKQHVALLIPLLLLVAACGGGDTFTPYTLSGSLDASRPTFREHAREILEDCAPDALAHVADWVELVRAVLENEAPGRGFAVDLAGIRLSPGLLIPWTLDVDGDGQFEAHGSFSLEDAAGQPIQPLGPAAVLALLAGGVGELGTVLAGLPDGTVLVTDLNVGGPPLVTGRIKVSFAAGEALGTSGEMSVSNAECSASVAWIGIPLQAFAGAYPSSTFRATFEHAADTLTGEISTDGSQTATASMSLNGSLFEAYEINLLTGEVTPL